MDKKEKKVEKSRGRAKTVQERAKAWDELNCKILAKKAEEEALALEKIDGFEDDEDDDEQLEDAVIDGVKDLEVGDAPVLADGGAAPGLADEEEDEIL